MDIKAEHARLGINAILRRLAGTCNDQVPRLAYEKVTYGNKDNIGTKTTCGLYMFFVQPKNEQTVFSPAYVGYTSRSFGLRFREHAKEGKLIGGFLAVQKDHKCDLFVSEFPCRPMIAKLLESIFLKAFDFAYNRMENGQQRDTVNLYTYNKQYDEPMSTSKAKFKEVFDQVKSDLDTIETFLQ